MPSPKRPPVEERYARRRVLHQDVAAGLLDWAEGVRRMRHALGMTQTEFARSFRISRHTLAGIEAGRAPKLATLEKLARVFGFRLGFVLRKPDEPPSST